jgi:hypothetical protein
MWSAYSDNNPCSVSLIPFKNSVGTVIYGGMEQAVKHLGCSKKTEFISTVFCICTFFGLDVFISTIYEEIALL